MATRRKAPQRGAAKPIKRVPKTAGAKRPQPAATARSNKGAKRPTKDKVKTAPGQKATAKKSVKRRSIGPLTPYLTVADASASLSFYARAFGFIPGETMTTPEGRLIHVVMHFKGTVAIMFSPEGIWSGAMRAPAHSNAECPVTMYVRHPKVDALTEQARAAGATILTEPADMFWGDRIARIADPDGYVWCFATRVGKFDVEKMPRVTEESTGGDLDFEF